MWRLRDAQAAAQDQQDSQCRASGSSDYPLADRCQQSGAKHCTESTDTSLSSLKPPTLISSRRQSQGTQPQQAAYSCSWQDSALSVSCQPSSVVCDTPGGRFFWVGQHARPSDSTDSSSSTSLFARALLSQNSVKKLPTHAVNACSAQLPDQQMSPHTGQCLCLAPEGSLRHTETEQWSLAEGPPLGSPGQGTEIEAPTACMQSPSACLDSPCGFGDPSMSTAGVDTWATDYSPEDVDQLLDWVADPELQSCISKPEHEPGAFSLCGSPDTCYSPHLPLAQGMQALNGKLSSSSEDGVYSLELPSSQGMQGLESNHSRSPDTSYSLHLASPDGMQGVYDRQLSCSWDTEPSHLDTQGCFQDNHQQQADSHLDDVHACSLLPDLDAFNQTASQQPSASEELMMGQSLSYSSDVSGDVLDQLMESALCSAPQEPCQQSDVVTVLHGGSCGLGCRDGKPGSFGETQGPQKKRCGRPRVYDLDTPLAAGSSQGPGAPAQVKGRGAKPKYICSTPQEAIAKRRKRNRDTATQSYYKRKQRITEFTNQMERLRQDNAALQSIMGLAPQLPKAQKGQVCAELRAAHKAPAAILQEVQEILASNVYLDES